ncbi:MAG: hypothetical protein IPH68_06700 [Chitinophagaceae bacterium]|nr:hypothetical protein [Chitinophagaceae bacterium]
MQTIQTSADLKRAILELEIRQANELVMLKAAIKNTAESLKPFNLIKNSLKDAARSPDLKVDVFNAAIGLTTGILAKKLVIGNTMNPLKKILGIFLEMAVANKVIKNADDIKSTGSTLLHKLFKRKEEPANP